MMEDISLHILDIAENAIAAGATRVLIAVNENTERDVLAFRVTDNGRGMSREERARAFDPFFTTKRKKTGLGLPLLAQTAQACGGRVIIESAPEKGTKVAARFRFSHVDRPPLTKMTETVALLVLGHTEIDVRYRHTKNGRRFDFHGRDHLGRRGAGAEEILAVRKALRTGLKRLGVS